MFDRPAHLVFGNLKQPPLIELLPSVTYGVTQIRATADRWDDADRKGDFGMSGKYGITSNITLDATVNPDFSQVESDAFQVEVNQRFPVFFSEKRPFFMEGMGLFDLAGTGGDSNMRTAVHTRRIINPDWGSKVTGTLGQVTFGLLNSLDASPQDLDNRGEAISGRRKLFTLGRATYALGQSNYAGAIMIDTEHAGRHNRVIGGDLSFRFSPRHSISTMFLASDTGVGSSSTTGTASQASYRFDSRRFAWENQVEHYDLDFRMDTAFFNRVGFTSGWSYGELNFFPREGSNFWLKRVSFFYFGKLGHDRVQDGDERFLNGGVRFNFTRQGYLQVTQNRGREPWAGQEFDTGGGINIFGRGQVLRWLDINGSFNRNRAIYYDPVDPFQGNSASNSFGVTLQPDQHFNQNIQYERVWFDRASTGGRVFTVDIVNLRTTYQFNRHFLVRLIEQYDSSRQRLLTDLLGSYEFVPGTVLHAGYGSSVREAGLLFQSGLFQSGRPAVARRRRLHDRQPWPVLQGVLRASLLARRTNIKGVGSLFRGVGSEKDSRPLFPRASRPSKLVVSSAFRPSPAIGRPLDRSQMEPVLFDGLRPGLPLTMRRSPGLNESAEKPACLRRAGCDHSMENF